jgi:hypothetical protein
MKIIREISENTSKQGKGEMLTSLLNHCDKKFNQTKIYVGDWKVFKLWAHH